MFLSRRPRPRRLRIHQRFGSGQLCCTLFRDTKQEDSGHKPSEETKNIKKDPEETQEAEKDQKDLKIIISSFKTARNSTNSLLKH